MHPYTEIGNLSISSYQASLLLAFALGVCLMVQHPTSPDLNFPIGILVLIPALLGALVGAKLIYAVIEGGNPYHIFWVWRGGYYYHGGLMVWHPIENEHFPNLVFDGMQAKERMRYVMTNGTTSHDIRSIKRQLMLGADDVSTAGPTMTPYPNPSNFMNDNHGAGQSGLLWQLMNASEANTVTLLQTWHILTGGWDIHNYWPLVDPWPEDENPAWPPEPFDPYRAHAIGMSKEGLSFSHWHWISFVRHLDWPRPGEHFFRVWKNGVTCLCNGPA